jgi:two-component system cell cycle sensor histidine kinase/response regulator CckA
VSTPERNADTRLDDHEWAEEALRASEERLNLVLRGGDLGLWVWDVKTGRLFVDERWAGMLGYSRDEIDPHVRSFESLIHPEDLPRMIQQRDAHLEGRTPHEESEHRMRAKSGEWVWVLHRGKVVERDQDGSPLRAAGTHLDITKRKRAELALQESRRALATLMSNLPGMAYRCRNDPDWTMEFASAGCVDLTGYQPYELVANAKVTYADLIHPDDRQQVWDDVQEAIRRRVPFQLNYRIVTAQGEERWVWEQGTGVFGADDTLQALEGFICDVTEGKRAEQVLRERENLLRTVINATKDAMISIGEDGLITLFNPAAEKLFGRSRGEMVGQPLDSLMPDEYRARHQDYIRAYFATGKPDGAIGRMVELPGLRSDGEVFPMEISLAAGELGERQFVVAVARDISARKRAEEERRQLEARVQQAQKLESLGVLAGGIAHDFNNLLVGILGNADLALDQLSPVSPARPLLQDIELAAKRAADLTRQMLAYSGKGRFVIEPLDLNEVVAEMAHLLEVSISKKAILKYNYADNLPAVQADGTQIRQVIMNLITNASEALGGRSGVISVSTGAMECNRDYLRETYLDEDLPDGVYVYLEVTDTGCGMDEETRQKIFDPFYTTKFTGRGLGLAAVLGIMRGHQGALKVQSEPGRGTTFRILLPALAEGRAERREQPALASGSRRTGTILLVDDEETVRAVGRRFLERAGFNVLTGSDGPQALELFRRHADDIVCVVLDLTMPHMDGEEAFRELSAVRADVRVIMSSGYNEQEVAQRFAGAGLAGFIQKPYRGSELLAKVDEALRSRP